MECIINCPTIAFLCTFHDDLQPQVGIRPTTQRGEPTAAYTQGILLAERCTDAEYIPLKIPNH